MERVARILATISLSSATAASCSETDTTAHYDFGTPENFSAVVRAHDGPAGILHLQPEGRGELQVNYFNMFSCLCVNRF